MSEHYDVVIIGAGQAGPPLAERCSAEGLRTAVVERKRVGGTCVNVGCIPTKTLVGSARVAWFAREAQRFGVRIGGPVEVDMAAVRARKDEIVAASNQGVTRWIEGLDGVDLLRGHARFTGERTLEVGGRSLRAERVFIDTGARARVPAFDGLETVDYLTNSTILELDRLPRHLLIIGGSYIGLEFAQIFRRFGAEVTVVEMAERLIPREDEDISAAVAGILEGEGVRLRLGAECIALRAAGDDIAVRVSCDDGPVEETGSHLLLAVGRVPNSDDLGVAAGGVRVDERGYIEVDEQLRTSAEGVWALGEVNGRGAFTHTSYNDYEIVAANLFDGERRAVSDRIACYGLFIDPPLGRVGMTEAEIRTRGDDALVGRLEMKRVGRAREFGETRGFMKIAVAAGSGQILGAAFLGLHGDEAVHTVADTMYAGAPFATLARAVHIHPTVAELVPTLLQDLEPMK